MLGSSSTGINSRISQPIGIDSAPIQPYSSVHLNGSIYDVREWMLHNTDQNGNDPLPSR